MKVLVTDAHDKKALAAIRFLAAAGCGVGVAGRKRSDQCFHSKFVDTRVVCPNPSKEPDAWALFMLDYLGANRFDCVLPMSDYTTLTLSRYKDDFLKVTGLCVPDYDVILLARDKPRMTEIAASAGIPTPGTWCPASLEEVRELSGTFSYPVVVKYKRGTGAVGCRYARSAKELITHYETPVHARDIVFDDIFPMIQEYIPGETEDVSVLFNRGEPRAALVSRRVRTLPAGGGRGVVNEVFRNDAFRDTVIGLLGEIKYHGPAQVEFKRDTRDGSLKFIEVNCRFWGGLGFACEAGINFAHLAARLAVDGEVEPRWEHEDHMFYRWPLPLELKSVLTGDNRFGELLEYFNRFRRGMRYDVWPSDPMPHLWEWGMLAYAPARKLLARVVGR